MIQLAQNPVISLGASSATAIEVKPVVPGASEASPWALVAPRVVVRHVVHGVTRKPKRLGGVPTILPPRRNRGVAILAGRALLQVQDRLALTTRKRRKNESKHSQEV